MNAAQKTASRMTRLKKSIELQKRTLRNLESMEFVCDGGASVSMCKQIIATLECQLSILSRNAAAVA